MTIEWSVDLYTTILISVSGLTVFIAFFILLKILEKNLPPGTSTMPLLGKKPHRFIGVLTKCDTVKIFSKFVKIILKHYFNQSVEVK